MSHAIPLVSIGIGADGVEILAPAHMRPSAARLSAPPQSKPQSYDGWASLGALFILVIAAIARIYILGA